MQRFGNSRSGRCATVRGGYRCPTVSLWRSFIWGEAPKASLVLKVLVVNSYGKGMGWEQDIQRGIVEGLRRNGYVKGEDYELKTFCMDTKVTYTTQE